MPQDTPQGRIDRIRPIFDHLGEVPQKLSLLGAGAQSGVWRVDTARASYALKVYKTPQGCLAPDEDVRLRRWLLAQGAQVIPPVLSSGDVSCPALPGPWVLDVFARGRPLSRGRLDAAQAAELGQTLHQVHRAPVATCPSLQELPALPGHIAPLAGSAAFQTTLQENRLAHVLTRPARPVLCHADIHPGQFLVSPEKQIVLLDFAGTRLCDRRWDLAHVMLCFDAPAYAAMAEAYGTPASQPDEVQPFAQALALAWVARGRAHQIRQGQQFLTRMPLRGR